MLNNESYEKETKFTRAIGDSLCMGCYDDKGNYDYHEFNEITIGDRGFDTAYILTSFVDTLRISPEIDFKLAENTHLKFEWVARLMVSILQNTLLGMSVIWSFP